LPRRSGICNRPPARQSDDDSPCGIRSVCEGQAAPADAVFVDDADRVLEVQGIGLSENAVEEGDVAVGLGAEPDGMGMDGVVAHRLKVRDGLWGERHVDEELQPVNSTVSSSARLAT
jgi:hypothetical protein